MKEKIQPQEKLTDEWQIETTATGTTGRRRISPEIQARMPTRTKTFMDIGPLELLKRDLKKLLGRSP